MSQYKIVFVPRWLDRVAKEMGINNQDLVSLEKLSCILSTRDVELYQMANFRIIDCVASVAMMSEKEAGELTWEFGTCIPILGLEKRAAYANVDVNTFIYGATATKDGEGQGTKYILTVELGDEDVIILRCSTDLNTEGTSKSFAYRFAEKMHGLMNFRDFARTNVFKQYVKEIQIY